MTDPAEERDEEDVRYGLVMPFIVCASQGGPYEDGAFVAGAQFAAVQMTLRMLRSLGVGTYSAHVDSRLIPQLDLLAMSEGWSLEAEPWDEHPDEWTLATFNIQAIGEPE